MLNKKVAEKLAYPVITLLNLFLVISIFLLLQNSRIYHLTLGKFSHNYEKVGDWGNTQILHVQKPYVKITSENLHNWDAAIYQCISERLYSQADPNCYHLVRPAFFPLFPVLWRISSLDRVGICLLNYFLFAVALAWLVRLLIEKKEERLFFFTLGLVLPSVFVFYIPYSEAVFFISMVIACAGLLRHNYWVYFLGMVAVAASRPGAVFVPAAILVINTVYFISGRFTFRTFLSDTFKLVIPYAVGLVSVIFMQWYYVNSWAALIHAQKYWSIAFGLPKQIGDWSFEGFGLNAFTLIFIILPCLIYALSRFVKALAVPQDKVKSIFRMEAGMGKSYLFHISIGYMMGMLLYLLFFRGGSLHSFFRFTLASPMFYIILFMFPYRSIRLAGRIIITALSIILLILFLSSVEYGRSRLDFSLFGMYLFIATYLLYMFYEQIGKTRSWVLLIFCGICSALWVTYIYNMLLSDAWVVA